MWVRIPPGALKALRMKVRDFLKVIFFLKRTILLVYFY